MESEEEHEWVTAALAGDEVAFARMVERYERPVFNLCYRMLGDPAEAEDAAQETFLRAYEGLNRYDLDRPFATWLLSIGAHYCIDQLRRRRFQLVSLESILLRRASRESQPETLYDRKAEKDSLQQELGALGSRERAAIILRYWYDLPYEEIAMALGITVSAVRSRLHRARRELADGRKRSGRLIHEERGELSRA